MRIKLFCLAKVSFVSLLLLIGLGAALNAVAQINPNPPKVGTTEITTNDSIIPLVYTVENTGATTVAPVFPSFANLPIIRPLPDPFVFMSTGVRDTSFAAWEQHRNEIMDAFETYMVGTKPDCHDCTITASYVTTSANHYTMTVTVTRNNPTNGLVTVTLTSAIVTPSGTPPAKGWPYIIGVGGATGSLPAGFFTNVAATVVYNISNVTTDDSNTGSTTDPFYKMYAPLCYWTCNGGTHNGTSGQFAAWSWGVSRASSTKCEPLSRPACAASTATSASFSTRLSRSYT